MAPMPYKGIVPRHLKTRSTAGLHAITLAVSVLGALLLGPAGAAQAAAVSSGPVPACTKVAGAAEAQSPVAFRAFVAGLLPGEVGCLAPGTYGGLNETFPMAMKQPGPRITLRAQDYATKPTIVGQLSLSGDSITASGMIFRGPAGCESPPPEPCVALAPLVINGSDVEVNRSEVKGSASHEGIHVGNELELPAPVNVRLVRNYVHDNGLRTDRTRANLDHGINWFKGSGLIANSIIANNYSYGVHLAPYVNGVRVTLNTIVGNGRSGVTIGDCDPAETSPIAVRNCTTPRGVDTARNNVVDNNIIAHNCTNRAFSDACYGGVGSFLLDAPSNGNIVTNNLFFRNYYRKRDQTCDGRRGCKPRGPRGLAYSRNFNRNPLFVGGPRSKGAMRFVLRSRSPAIGRATAPRNRDLKKGHDFAGYARPAPKATKTDLGAFEYRRKPKRR